MELGRLFGFLHPALVHFPLVLLLVAFVLDTIGFVRRDERIAAAAKTTLILGAVATLFAFVCGNFAEIWAARDGVPQEPMEQHELYATITSWLFVFLAAVRMYLGTDKRRRWMLLYLTFMAAACVLLVITGHKGAMLVYHHGAGVQLGTAPALPTHEDLAVLRQKQDPEALWYSDNMHHVFGWMVLIFSGLLLLEMIAPKLGTRLRAVTPLLLLAGGIFLMIRSDTDSWPLSNQRPITDKEVVMHKTYAVLMLVFGIQGLRRRKKKSASESGYRAILSGASGSGTGDKQQGRMMAVFSLIGGALLFTHVHSNAPYANVAVGVYLHHTVMGFIALCIGAVKLAEDSLPLRSARGSIRALAWAYPCLMLVESIFLLNYNEGLPWFLGYRGLSLAAPHNGLIAPLGKARAELVFDPTTCLVDVYLLQHSSNAPFPVAASDLPLVARVGTESTEVGLTVCPEAQGNYHFRGSASFLAEAGMFQAKALLKENAAAGANVLVADFEPWTDGRIAAGHTSQAAYVCPMHPAVGAGVPGRCEVCGMVLIPNKAARPWDKLHDDRYRMDLVMTDKEPSPGQKVRLALTLHGTNGAIVSALDTVHTKKLHLIVVNSDLSFFDHVHPEQQPDGSLTLDYAFPAPGEYTLYSDLTPSGDRNQVFANEVKVSGTAAPRITLEPTPAQAKVFGDYRVRLDLSPDPIKPGDETQLTFTISENGVPVTDLEPYLGAGGHCVALSEDRRGYLHSHPLQMGGKQFGPSVTFHGLFPRPGLYKIWGQFSHKGKLLVADFVIRVP